MGVGGARPPGVSTRSASGFLRSTTYGWGGALVWLAGGSLRAERFEAFSAFGARVGALRLGQPEGAGGCYGTAPGCLGGGPGLRPLRLLVPSRGGIAPPHSAARVEDAPFTA